jgi:hypothetical protein
MGILVLGQPAKGGFCSKRFNTIYYNVLIEYRLKGGFYLYE